MYICINCKSYKNAKSRTTKSGTEVKVVDKETSNDFDICNQITADEEVGVLTFTHEKRAVSVHFKFFEKLWLISSK